MIKTEIAERKTPMYELKAHRLPEDPAIVLCYGDSNTFGYDPRGTGDRYPYAQRWTTLLEKRLGEGYRVIPEGLSGRTTAYDREDVWKNGLTALRGCLASHAPLDTVIFLLGANDCNVDLNLSPRQIAEGMEQLICVTEEMMAVCQYEMPTVILAAPAAIRPEFAGTPFADMLDDDAVAKSHAIAPLYADIARRHGCLFLDGTDLEVSSVDCEHLTIAGHAQLADRLYELMKTGKK